MTLGRSLISIVMLLIMMWMAGGYLPKTYSEWWPFIVLGAINQAVPFALTGWGQLYIEGGLASILLSVMPLFTLVLAAWFTTDERLTLPRVVGIVLGLVGIILLIGPEVLAGALQNLLAQLAIVAAALLYAISAVYVRFVYPQQPKDLSIWALRLRIVTAQFIGSAIVLAPFSLWIDKPWAIAPPPAITWLHLAMLGIGVTLLATMVYFWLIEQFGASRAATTIYLIPVAGVISSAIVLGEKLTPQMVLALIFIFIGIFVVNRG